MMTPHSRTVSFAVVCLTVAAPLRVIASGSGKEEFNGVLTADGKTISGAFNVNGFSAPIDFTRTGDARIDRPVSPPIGKEFEGAWNGVLDVGDRRDPSGRRVVLRNAQRGWF